ncbi:hypothetical protein MXD81_53390 [Microbacteriaceae bacterium K1510]|nr:hypothetical protein [Microbacteriaceae bacterium K1510]
MFIAIGAVVTLLFTHPFFQVDYAGVAVDGGSRSTLWVVWPTLEPGMWSILLLVYLNAVQSIPASSFVAALGKYSYSTYAGHILVMEIAKARFLWLSPYAFGALVVLPISMLISWWSYYLIEAPFLGLRSRYTIAAARPEGAET